MANLRFIQAQSFQISAAGASSGDTTLTIQSFKYSDGTTNIVTADLGDQCYGTLEPNNGTQEEAIQFTGVTQNSNGTATLTGVSSLGFKSPYTVTSGLSKSHAGGVTLILSNDAAMYGNIITYINNTAASGAASASDTVQGLTKVTFNQGSNPRARSTIVSQHLTGDMTMLVNTFSYQNSGTTITFVGKTLGYINGSVSSTFVAPVSNPRYDLIVYRPSLTDCTSITGTEAASPALPTPTVGDIVLASIYHRTAETKILERDDSTNGYVSVWYEPTPYVTATSLTNQQTTFGTDQSQTTQQTTYAVGESNLTTKHSIVAQSFVPTVTGIQGVKLWKITDTGTFTGTVKISLQASTSSSPSGSDLASYTISNASWLKLTNAAEFSIAFTTEYESLVVGNTYWIVISPSTSDNSNHPNVGYDNTSAHSLVLKYNNSADGWVSTATACLYYKTTCGILSKVVQTDSTSGLIPTAVRPYSFIAAGAGTAAANTAAETTVFSKLVEGGLFTANSGIHVRVCASSSTTNTGVSSTMKLYLGAAQLASVGFANLEGNSITARGSQIDFYILNNASTSAQNYSITGIEPFTTVRNSTFATTTVNLYTVSTGTTTVDTTATPDLIKVTFTNSTGTQYTTTCDFCLIEKIG